MITCNFETDFCNWQRLPETAESTFAWVRNNSDGLSKAGIENPGGDRGGNKAKYFAIASNMVPANSPADATADLISPYLKGSDHPVECFGFWAYLNGPEDRLRVWQRIINIDDPVLKWEIDSSYMDAQNPQWIKGQFEIKAENIREYRMEFQAIRGSSESGFIAIDDLDFLGVSLCEFRPEAAKPTTATTTTSTTPSTTPAQLRKMSRHFL